MESADATFGKRLRSIRTRLRLTQTDIATELGLTKASVSGWEVGRSHPSFTQLEQLAAFLRVPPGQFFWNSGKPHSGALDQRRLAEVIANIENCTKREFDLLPPDKKARLIAHLYAQDVQPNQSALRSLLELVR